MEEGRWGLGRDEGLERVRDISQNIGRVPASYFCSVTACPGAIFVRQRLPSIGVCLAVDISYPQDSSRTGRSLPCGSSE
ncbi:3-hydroxyacyl-CoA dehydrogenase [Anopheles sinensis]|uniref:3-hydroxyacyl-CoA dehydrogenase n=1 Tax=Anopheles sinensis TaxID=74873 RepID=A0A084VE12_ANOSI|nr:3-hydroxyacyl-CoA dehydrogenase [Anopheles sinensis]